MKDLSIPPIQKAWAACRALNGRCSCQAQGGVCEAMIEISARPGGVIEERDRLAAERAEVAAELEGFG